MSASVPVSLEERLERGEIVSWAACPFALPGGDDLAFLFGQRLHGPHKSISLDPQAGRTVGFPRPAPQAQRLQQILRGFGESATAWLADLLPRYARCWRPERVNFHPEEEATRCLRLSARNDLLHLDAFPSRPTGGWRILRLFVNINSTDPRIWITSETFAELLARYGKEVGLPRAGEDSLAWQLGQRMLGLFRPGGRRRSVYDRFMLRFHHFLKMNEKFQERCRKRFWSFPPGSAWLVLTDAVSYAVLRGRYALDRTFFVAPEGLVLPELSPPVLLQRACGVPVCRWAA
jgi:hypothetical protein